MAFVKNFFFFFLRTQGDLGWVELGGKLLPQALPMLNAIICSGKWCCLISFGQHCCHPLAIICRCRLLLQASVLAFVCHPSAIVPPSIFLKVSMQYLLAIIISFWPLVKLFSNPMQMSFDLHPSPNTVIFATLFQHFWHLIPCRIQSILHLIEYSFISWFPSQAYILNSRHPQTSTLSLKVDVNKYYHPMGLSLLQALVHVKQASK